MLYFQLFRIENWVWYNETVDIFLYPLLYKSKFLFEPFCDIFMFEQILLITSNSPMPLKARKKCTDFVRIDWNLRSPSTPSTSIQVVICPVTAIPFSFAAQINKMTDKLKEMKKKHT